MKPKPTEEAKQRAKNYMRLKGALEPVVDSPLNIYQMKIYNELESLGFFEWLSETHNLKDTDMKPEYLDELPLDDIHRTVCNSMALRWFREKYKIRFIIQSSMSDLGEYFKVIFPNGEQRNVSYNTYEEAELAAIVKLIEIVKKQNFKG